MKKSIKAILCMVIAITMLISSGIQAFADNSEQLALDSNCPSMQELAKENANATGGFERICYVGNISNAKGTSVPTSAWNFWDGVYSASFTEVAAGIYTSYYFTGVNTLKVYFSNLHTESGSAKLVYYLIDLTNNSSSGPYYSNTLSTSSSEEVYRTFSGLTTSHHYCVWLRSNNTSKIDGNIIVSTTNGG